MHQCGGTLVMGKLIDLTYLQSGERVRERERERERERDVCVVCV